MSSSTLYFQWQDKDGDGKGSWTASTSSDGKFVDLGNVSIDASADQLSFYFRTEFNNGNQVVALLHFKNGSDTTASYGVNVGAAWNTEPVIFPRPRGDTQMALQAGISISGDPKIQASSETGNGESCTLNWKGGTDITDWTYTFADGEPVEMSTDGLKVSPDVTISITQDSSTTTSFGSLSNSYAAYIPMNPSQSGCARVLNHGSLSSASNFPAVSSGSEQVYIYAECNQSETTSVRVIS